VPFGIILWSLGSSRNKLIWLGLEKVLHLHFSYFLALQLFLKSETFLANVSHQRVLGIKHRAITKDFRID
jgi:hypothetical protein